MTVIADTDDCMAATLEQIQADLVRLLGVVQQGEEVVITSQGRPVAKLTGTRSNKAPAICRCNSRLDQRCIQACSK
jgi:prevent-host-death family protein